MNELRTEPKNTRTRLLLWGGLIVLVLLVPAILIPIVLSLSQQPAFQALAEVKLDEVRSIELFLLNRPDGGPDIGSTKAMYIVPPNEYPRLMSLLQPVVPQADDTGRGIWLGRMVVTMNDRRRQTVLFHRPKNEENTAVVNRLELRIGRQLFTGPAVNAFAKSLGELAGVESAPEK